jgi:hypothetical protein
LVLQIAPTIKDLTRREEVYRKALGIYGGRQDLQGEILIALGDLYKEQNNKDKAVSTYADTAARCVDLAQIVVPAAARAEAILLENNQRDPAIRLYSQLFSKTRKSQAAEMFRQQSAHYQLGDRLAKLLESAGQPDAAKRVRDEIEH